MIKILFIWNEREIIILIYRIMEIFISILKYSFLLLFKSDVKF